VRVAASAIALLASGCGGRAPHPAASEQAPFVVAIEGLPQRAVLGVPFEFAVQRAWLEPLVPEPIAPEAFAPLVVVRLDRDVATRGGATHEVQRLRAHALALGQVATAPLVFSAAAGATRERVEHAPVVVEVAGALAPDDASRAEVGFAPLGPRARSALAVALVLAALVGATLVAVRRRRPAAVDPAPEPRAATAPTRDELLATLLADLVLSGRSDAEHYDALVGAVRAGLGVRDGRDFAQHTARELATLVRSPAVCTALARSERVRFAGEAVDAATRSEDVRHVSAALRRWCAGAAEDGSP
jgi:hypothetical protein